MNRTQRWMTWLLRECVRANPLYVISAMLLSWGVYEFLIVVDPQTGKRSGNLIALGLIHSYELALLCVATIVLRKRTAGTRSGECAKDCHGLMIVASLFLAGSFIAFDELIAMDPFLGPILTLVALAIAFAKLEWYARLPGINLTRGPRGLLMILLTCQALAPVLGALELNDDSRIEFAQHVSWLLGWLSLIPIFVLMKYSEARERERRERGLSPFETQEQVRSPLSPPTQQAFPSTTWDSETSKVTRKAKDPLGTNTCAQWGIGITVIVGTIHLIACDWVFDHQPNALLFLPSLITLLGIYGLWRNQCGKPNSFWLMATPAIIVHWLWYSACPWSETQLSTGALGPTTQISFACLLVYVGMTWATRNLAYCLGIISIILATICTGLQRFKIQIPHLKALTLSLSGFLCLIGGMLISLYKERILQWIEASTGPESNQPAEKIRSLEQSNPPTP